ncbi:hypothetical protein [Allorhizocola rhizosphaerae]|uniref:hypothetical protein n=1 Tax=Allorhizocola rhizosphaerae TaxID=1872709 RepID=UPI000E3DBD47|nr:hypothetical protein [Allorhizocola rhizosphaerae]
MPAVPTARAPVDDRATAGALDEIGDEERWLWRLVVDAERVSALAPPAPDADRLACAEQRYVAACQAEQRIQTRIRATEAALARPGSWLRPAHRSALAKHLKEDRAAAVLAAVQRGRVEEVLNRLRTVAAAHASYLAKHHATLAAGRNARAELERIFDDLIDGYARLQAPPAWFRFGLGFPPPPGAQREWLAQARETLAQRRRLAIEQPHWPEM